MHQNGMIEHDHHNNCYVFGLMRLQMYYKKKIKKNIRINQSETEVWDVIKHKP